MSPERWLAFVGVLLVVLFAPGPDFLVVFRHALHGFRTGARAAGGVVTGLAIHTAIAAAGIAAVIAAHPPVFRTVQLAGAAYLTWLGIMSLRAFLSRRRAAPAADTPAGGTHPYRDGLLSNALNPKAILFFVGLLPQFVNSDGNLILQTLILAATTICLATLWLLLLVFVVGKGVGLLTRPPVRRAIDGIAAATFFGLAVSFVW